MTDSNETRPDEGAGRTPEGTAPSNVGVRTPEHMIDPPPIMSSWRRFYGLVLFILAADVVVFWVVTRVFS